MIRVRDLLVFVIGSFVLVGCPSTFPTKTPPPTAQEKVAIFKESVRANTLPLSLPPKITVDTIEVDSINNTVRITFSKEYAASPVRQETLSSLQTVVDTFFRGYYQGFQFSLFSDGRPLAAYIPNYFRSDSSLYDHTRLPRLPLVRPQQLVTKLSAPYSPSAGLQGRNIVLWHSHGWYFDVQENRWEWQRPRLFQSVEDLIPMSFTIPFLIPMLENAGANVFVPRERDTQIHEVVVDNDVPSRSYSEKFNRKRFAWIIGDRPGFAVGTPPYPSGLNPFQQGTFRFTSSDTIASASVSWMPRIPTDGEYAVYVSYASSEFNVEDARYQVYHAGGITSFSVNQQIGGGTWIYLGTFLFHAGSHPREQKVVLTNESTQAGRIVSADAVRFGGGLGTVQRGGRTSGRPKYMEASRYYLQYAGMPDTLVYSFNRDRNDYNDDYVSRGEYVNYLYGAPFGPNKDRSAPGLHIPIDLSLAFHTDAGITQNDSIIGTLAIYSSTGYDTAAVFPDSVSRMANRDLADIVQTQIVGDMQSLYTPAWTRRQLRDARYSEATRPNVPSLLLELLSHQNFADMRFALDPGFRFDVARAIYKGILRFLSVQYRTPSIVQPLPVTHFRSELTPKGTATLRWRPAVDSLEPLAFPDRYVVYKRKNNEGFDNGILVNDTVAVIANLIPGVIYSFKITAVNEGGESFPSEILSICWMKNGTFPMLIVNGFDRVSGPTSVDLPNFRGFIGEEDNGIPYKYDLGFTGTQFDFRPSSPYRFNDAPGHGASYADHETEKSAGNTFDFPFIHGLSLRTNGYSFVSCSDEAVTDSLIDLREYRFVDLILGEERSAYKSPQHSDSLREIRFSVFPKLLQERIQQYCNAGGKLLVTGAYVLADLFSTSADSLDTAFARQVLHGEFIANHASRNGVVFSVDSTFMKSSSFRFNTTLSDSMYAVESPGTFVPVGGGTVLLRYRENEFAAAIGFRNSYGVFVCGFPFETIAEQKYRDQLMRAVLTYLRL